MTLEDQDSTILDAETTEEVDNFDTEPDEDNSETEPTQENSEDQATEDDEQEHIETEKADIPEKYKKFITNKDNPTEQELALVKHLQEQDNFITKVTQEKSELQKTQELEKQRYEQIQLQNQSSKLDKDYTEGLTFLQNEKNEALQPYLDALKSGEITQEQYNFYSNQADTNFLQRKNVLDALYAEQKQDTDNKIKEHLTGKVTASYQKFETDFSDTLSLPENKGLYEDYKSEFNEFGKPEELPMIFKWADKYYQTRKARESKSSQLDSKKQQLKAGLKGSASNGSAKVEGGKRTHTVEDLLNDPKAFDKYFN